MATWKKLVLSSEIAQSVSTQSLDVSGNSTFGGSVTIASGGSTDNLYLANTSYGMRITNSTGVIDFISNGSPRMSIANGGDVTVTSRVAISSAFTNNELLGVKGSVGSDWGARIENTSSTGAGALIKSATTNAGTQLFQVRSGSDNVFTIMGDQKATFSGKVAISSDFNAGELLGVKGSANTEWGARIDNTSSTGYGALVRSGGTNSSQLLFQVRGGSVNALTIRGDSSSTFAGSATIVGIVTTGNKIVIGNNGNTSGAYNLFDIEYTGYNSGSPELNLTPPQAFSGTVYSYVHLNNKVVGAGTNNLGLKVDYDIRAGVAVTPITNNTGSLGYTGLAWDKAYVNQLWSTGGGSWSSSRRILYADASGVNIQNIDNNTTDAIRFRSYADVELVTILDGGNVGIGVDSPTHNLNVYNGSGGSNMTVGKYASGKTVGVLATSADTSGYFQIQSYASQGTTFGILSLNRAGGNVNIGTSGDYAKLTVGGTGDIVALRASSGTAGFTMYEAGTGRFNMTTLNGSGGIAFKVPTTTALTIDSSATSTFTNSGGASVQLATSSNGTYAVRSGYPAKFSHYYFNGTSGSIYKNDGTQFLSFGSDKKATFYGHIFLPSTGTSTPTNHYIATNNSSTGTGSLIIQAGEGSAGFGGGLRLYSHSHATYGGWVTAGISSGSGGKFSVNTHGLGTGTNVFTVDASGNGTFSGDVRLPNSGKLYLWNDNSSNYLRYNNWQASASSGMTIANTSGLGSIILKSGNSTALTLDSSQGATFTGNIKPSSDSAISLGTDSVRFLDIYTDGLDLRGDVYSILNLNSAFAYALNRNWRITTNNFGSGSWGGISIDQSTAAGGTSFVQKFGIDINGNVGIGTSSPAQGQSTPISNVKLDVLGNQMLSNLSTTNTDQSKLIFFRSDGAVSSQGVVPDGLKMGAIEWDALTSGDNNNSIPSARIETEASNTWSSASVRNADITFSTVKGNALTEKMRITSNGNLGIGTDSPDYQLELEKGGGGFLSFKTTDTEIQNNDVLGTIQFGADDATTSGIDIGAKIVATATDNFQSAGSNVDAPTKLEFFTQDNTTTDVMSTVGATLTLGGDDQNAKFVGQEVRIQKDDGRFIIQRTSTSHQAEMWMVGNQAYFGSTNGTTVNIRTNNQNALIINTAQQATFTSNVTTGGTLNVVGASSATATLNINANNGASANNKVRFLKETGAEFKLQMNTGGVSSFANLVNFTGTGTTFNNDVTLTSSTSSSPFLIIQNTNEDDNMGGLKFIKDSVSPNTGDKLMQIWAFGDNLATEQILYSEIATLPTRVTDGSEEGSMRFRVMNDGSFGETMRIRGNKVGIGTSFPDNELHITDGSAGSVTANSNSQVTIESNSHASLQFLSPNSANSIIYFGDEDNDVGYINYVHSSNTMNFQTNTAVRLSIEDSGNVNIGSSSKTNNVGSSARGLTIGNATAPVLSLWDTTNAGYHSHFFQVENNAFLRSSGNLTIQTNAGTTALTVDSNQITNITPSSNTGVSFDNASNNIEQYFRANSVDSIAKIKVSESAGGGVIGLWSKNTSGTQVERLNIDTSGNSTFAGDITVSKSGNAFLNLTSTGGGARIKLTGQANETTNGLLFYENSNIRAQVNYNHSTDKMEFKTHNSGNIGATLALTIDGDQNATFEGNIEGVYIETFSHNFTDDLGTSNIYIPWQGTGENTSMDVATTAFLTPFAMELVSFRIRPETISNSGTINVQFYKQANGSTTRTDIGMANTGTLSTNNVSVLLASAFDILPTVSANEKVGFKFLPSTDLGGAIDWYVTTVWKVTKLI